MLANNINVTYLEPQEGPQTEFLQCNADVVFYGGAAGGGKSFGLLIDPLCEYDNQLFHATILRKTSTQIRKAGSLWDQSMRVYGQIAGAEPVPSRLQWTFPTGMRVEFSNLEHEQDVYNYQGAELPYIAFDELTHFSEFQFWYMFSRNRSMTGVKPRIRATMNPDADSWIARFIKWYIGPDGFIIPERSGVIRWFIRLNDEIIWADTKRELIEKYGNAIPPKSFTFIKASVYDNQALLKSDPTYVSNLLALQKLERERLLNGNWKIRATAGNFFKRQWFPIVQAIPAGWIKVTRFWDRAATKPTPEKPDPDWTRGLKLYTYPNGKHLVADLKSAQDTPGKIEDLIKNTASHDGHSVRVVSQQDPGSAGVAEAEHFVRMLNGFSVGTLTFSKDKATRAKPVSAQAEVGNIEVLEGPWNEEFFLELENFPEGKHDDVVDVLSGAYNENCAGHTMWDVM